MSAWGKSLASVSTQSGDRQQPSTPSAFVPDSVGPQQSEMSLGVFKGTQSWG